VIETAQLRLEIADSGYVSGIRAGTLRDKATGAVDLGFGLDVVDFLLEPADASLPIPPGQYEFGPRNAVHGNIPKRYVEGPQICTQAKRLSPVVGRGPNFTAVTMTYRWNVSYNAGSDAGSVWKQTVIVPDDTRYILCADRVTTVSRSEALSLRIDMPGHIQHGRGHEFEHIYLSYNDPPILPSTEFTMDFPPDARFLYTRGESKRPERFIRAYQVAPPSGRSEGPWLAGMTLNVDDVAQAWCHQRGYVCLIEEIGGRPTKPGDTFGAAYIIGWFDGINAMNEAYDAHAGWSGLAIDGPEEKPTGYRGLSASALTPVGSR
jgi:hypothetical protein